MDVSLREEVGSLLVDVCTRGGRPGIQLSMSKAKKYMDGWMLPIMGDGK